MKRSEQPCAGRGARRRTERKEKPAAPSGPAHEGSNPSGPGGNLKLPLTQTELELLREDLELQHLTLVESQAELETSRERYADLYDQAPVGYLTLNRAGCIKSINLFGARLLGQPREHLVGHPFMFFIDAGFRRDFLRHLSRCRKGSQRESVELALARKNGDTDIFVELVSTPGPDVDPGQSVFKSILMDITARHHVEKELRKYREQLEDRVRERTEELRRSYQTLLYESAEREEAEARLRESQKALADFFTHAPVGLLWVGPDGRIMRVNQALLEMLGCPGDECWDHPIAEFFPDPELAEEALRDLAAGKTLRNFRARLRQQNGTLLHALIDANGLWEEDRLAHSRWFIRDISRRVELEREILAISEREQRRLGRDLHDDLGQQLTGIEFLSQSLARQLAGKAEPVAEKAREISRLVRNAITHTRELARGLSPMQLDKLGLADALKELADRTRRLFDIDCRFESRQPVSVPDEVLGTHLYRIAQEAVSNAIKHGKARSIAIALTRNHDRIVLGIEDNGIGFPKKLRTRKGMGLRVMQYRAGMVGGSLAVQRNTNGGTTVVCSVKETLMNHSPKKK